MVELDEARLLISALEPALTEAHTSAVAQWATFLTESPELALPLDATARANFIHCHIRSEVARRLADHPDAVDTDALGFFALRVGDRILLRFKCVTHGEPQNYPTAQQKLLGRQAYTEDMLDALGGDPALAAPTLLTCGYTLEGDQIGRIEIRRDCKGHLPWSYDIYGGTAITEPLVLDGMADEAKPAKISSKTVKREAEDAQNSEPS